MDIDITIRAEKVENIDLDKLSDNFARAWTGGKFEVFLFGSKSIGELPQAFIDEMDFYMAHNAEFIVGDCTGADLAIQNYLAEKNWEKVTIYCSAHRDLPDEENMPRNNVGNWPVVRISSTEEVEPEGYEFRRLKDMGMVDACEKAICVWDGKSKGTKKNLIELEERGIMPKILNKSGEVITDGNIRLLGTWYFDMKDMKLYKNAVPEQEAEQFGGWEREHEIFKRSYSHWIPELNEKNAMIKGEVRRNCKTGEYEVVTDAVIWSNGMIHCIGNDEVKEYDIKNRIVKDFGLKNVDVIWMKFPKLEVFSMKAFNEELERGVSFKGAKLIFFYDDEKPAINVEEKRKGEDFFYCKVPDIEMNELEEYRLTYDTFWPEVGRLANRINAVRDTRIVCICENGQSRSAGCAAAIAQFRDGNGIDYFSSFEYTPNKLIYKKLLEELQKQHLIRYKMWADWLD